MEEVRVVLDAPQSQEKIAERVLSLRDVTHLYGDYAALNRMNLHVDRGEIVGLLGPNGAGKTTLLEIAEGIKVPSSGEVTLCGERPDRMTESLRGAIGLVFQRHSLPGGLTVSQFVNLMDALYPDGGHGLSDTLGLAHLMPKKIRELSVGQQQRLSIFCALYGRKKLLILDEPTSALDVRSRQVIREALLQRRDTHRFGAIIATHQMDEAHALCDRIYILERGSVRLHGVTRDLVAAANIRCRVEFNRPINEAAYLELREALKVPVTNLGSGRMRLACDRDEVSRFWKLITDAELKYGFGADCTIAGPTLEDVYLDVIGGEK